MGLASYTHRTNTVVIQYVVFMHLRVTTAAHYLCVRAGLLEHPGISQTTQQNYHCTRAI